MSEWAFCWQQRFVTVHCYWHQLRGGKEEKGKREMGITGNINY
jgi:hypothetical protein